MDEDLDTNGQQSHTSGRWAARSVFREVWEHILWLWLRTNLGESTAETYGHDPTLSWSCPLSHTNRRKLGTPQGQQKNKQAGNHPHGCSSPCPRPLFRSRNIVSHLDYHSRLPPLPRHPHGPRAGLPTTRSRGKGHAPQHLQSLFKSVQFTARL